MSEKPWDQLQGEKSLWYDRFTRYRLMGPDRSLLGAYKQWLRDTDRIRQTLPRRAPQTWHDAAKRWDWKLRANAWDEDNRQQLARDEEEARLAMRQRHIENAKRMLYVGTIALNQLRKKVEEEKITLSVHQVVALLTAGTNMERTAAGLPKFVIELLGMSDEELKDYAGGILSRFAEMGVDPSPDDEAWYLATRENNST